jgi:hypothetical protein
VVECAAYVRRRAGSSGSESGPSILCGPSSSSTSTRSTRTTSGQQLFGIYSTGPAPLLPVDLDLYWLGIDNPTATFNGTSGRELRQTLGVRTWGPIGRTGLDFEIEAAGQFGTLGKDSIGAGMATGILDYTVPFPLLSPRVYLEFDYASRDGRPGGNVGTLNQLYPSNHMFLGLIDYIGRQNIVSPSAGLNMSPLRGLTLSLQQYFFWRASARDALYDNSGDALRPGTGTRATYVGAEIDLFATYAFTRHLLGYAGYSRFFAGDFIKRTDPSQDSDVFYGALQYTF